MTMMKKITRFVFMGILLFGFVVGLCGCDVSNQGNTETSGNISLDGSTSMEKTIGCLGEAYMMRYPDVNVTFNPTGSGSGIVAVADGRCDIGLSSRALSEEEKKQGLTETILAYDGIAVVVHPENEIEELSAQELADIFCGKITNWKDLGGRDCAIVVVGREAASGTRTGFEDVLGVEEQCQYRQELTSAGDVMTSVSQNPAAIGYTSFASLHDKVAVVAVDEVFPSEQTIQNGSYSIQRPFVLVTKKDRPLSPSARAFFDYMTSAAATELISFSGVVAAAE